ncbi:META domain-containing protein, partial [Saprospiraceae bacterium]|nr:META domain-containing protein [Saprospiraceae bacterium]
KLIAYYCKLLLFMLACILYLNSCNIGKNNSSKQVENNQESVSLTGSWILTDFLKEDITFDRSNPSRIPTLDIDQENMKVSGTDGCNKIFTQLEKLNHQEINIAVMGGTKMACKMKKPYDTKYRNSLSAASTFKSDGYFLILYDKNKNELLKFEKIIIK